MFNSKKSIDAASLHFTTRSEAFVYMMSRLSDQGVEPMAAAEQAGRFAQIYGDNLGLPVRTEPPQEGIDKYLAQLDKLTNYCEQHPKAIELLVGAASFLSGLVVAGKVQQPPPSHPSRKEEIDFESID